MTSWLLGVLLCGSFALLVVERPALSATAARQGVVSENRTAARDALSILNQGGTAADAAITAALVSGVASPTSSGIGGGGFLVAWDASKKQPYVLDFRETAPAGAQREPLERRPLERAETGHLIGVPGEVRGLYALHQRAGKLPWSKLVQRAVDRARKGFPVSRHLANMLVWARPKLQQKPGFGGFFPGGQPAGLGTRLTNPALAATLEKVASEGPRGFYEGSVAADIVQTANAHGGKMTLDDLREYRPVERKALRVRYAGRDVYTMPAPSAGGLMLAQVLSMFPADELRRLGHGSAAYRHLIAEGMRGAIADRARYLADPKAMQVDSQTLLDSKRLEARRASISVDRTHALPRFGLEEHGTHHLVARDSKGNAVSLTTTVNRLFGSKIIAEASGVVLNDELDDFTDRASVKAYGMADTPNHLRPGARPVSSMTPTLVVRDGVVELALGGSGGTAIATNVTQVLLAALVFGHDAKRAVSAPRFYVPTSGPTILLEKGASEAEVADLAWRGEVVGKTRYSTTAVQLLQVQGGAVSGAADPRKHGEAALR